MAETNTVSQSPTEEVTPAEHTRSGRYYRPNVDILEQADELIVLADMPGASGDAIDVNFEDGNLTIHAKVDPRQDESTEYLVREYGVGDFYRTFRISEAIDASKITAQYADGVLTLHLPKAEEAKPRKIAVTMG
jgi:HSP20 family protein